MINNIAFLIAFESFKQNDKLPLILSGIKLGLFPLEVIQTKLIASAGEREKYYPNLKEVLEKTMQKEGIFGFV